MYTNIFNYSVLLWKEVVEYYMHISYMYSILMQKQNSSKKYLIAPKLNRENTRINWNKSAECIYNFVSMSTNKYLSVRKVLLAMYL